MSSAEVADAVGELDFRTAEEVLNGSVYDAVDADADLGKVLPKLSKRISQSNTLNKEGDGGEGDQQVKRPSEDQAPLDFSAVDVALESETAQAEDQRMPSSQVKSQPRASGSHASGAPGSITVMVRPSSGLSPELERLRLQDINPDENSAAFLAITGAGAGASGPSAGSGADSDADNTPAKRRMSLSRQLSGRYQKTNRKVEGREIQQDHSQYMLTYALMLGIRVMTGRRDPELDKRQSMSRKGKGSSEDLQATAAGSGFSAPTDSAPPVVSPTTVAAPPTAGSTSTTSSTTSTNTSTIRRPLSFAFSTHGSGGGSGSGQESGPNSLGFGLPSLSQRDWDSASARQMLVERELTIADFDEALELKFKPQGSSDGPMPTPPHKLNFSFKFKDYMPAVFRAVRGMSNIDEADYMLSLAGDFNYIEFIANSKSGQFFFYSHDGCYMIKTQTKEECVLLRDIMPKYVAHLTSHPNSLLVRFYGMHRVKFKNSKIYFVIMSSVFNTEKHIDIKFDLKGSLAGRRTSDKACKQGAVQKDLNLMESGRKIRLGENAELFHETLKADVELLASLKIMDYSLLVGIHDKKNVTPTPGSAQRRSSGVVLSQNQRASALSHASAAMSDVASVAATEGTNDFKEAPTVFQSYYGGIPSAQGVDEIYFMGIIDILQRYNLSKQTETFYKGIFADKMLQSSVPPELYASRMLDFIMKHTDHAEVAAQRHATAAAPAPGSEEAKAARRDLL